MTLAVACDRWWSEVGQHSAETDLRTALIWLRDQIGPERYLQAITNDDISRAVEARRRSMIRAGRDDDGKQLYRPVKPRTVNRTVVFLLRRVMKRAAENWNVAIFDWPKWRSHLLPEVKLPIAEMTDAMEEARDAVDLRGYGEVRKFATITGLRLREVLLTWPQVDFANAVVRVIAKGKRPRIVPLSKEAYQILWQERGRHPTHVFTYEARTTMTVPKSGQKIIKGQRYPITAAGIKSHRKRAWTKAGAPGRWHDLRHTAAMRAMRATGNLQLVQNQLGHSSITTTARFYTDVMVEDVRAGMEAVASMMQSRKKSRSNPADATQVAATQGEK